MWKGLFLWQVFIQSHSFIPPVAEHLKNHFPLSCSPCSLIIVSELHHNCYLNTGCSQQTCTTTYVWHQMQIWKETSKIYLTPVSARLSDVVTACLVVWLSLFLIHFYTDACTYCSHSHAHIFTHRQQWCHCGVLWSHAVVWLSQPQGWACCAGKKPAFGRSYLDRLKNPCPAVYISQHTASVMVPPDTPLLYCISTSFSLCPTSISFYLDALPSPSPCLHSAYSPFNLYFFCCFPVRL